MEPGSRLTPEEVLLSQAVVLLSCASYRNQCLNVFIRPALLALAIHTASSNKKRKKNLLVFECAAVINEFIRTLCLSKRIFVLVTSINLLYFTFFLSRGDLQQFQFSQEHVLQRVHPLSRSYSSGGKPVFIYSERNLKGSALFTCFSPFIGFLLDYMHDARCSAAACHLCCLLPFPVLFTMFNYFLTSANVKN